MNNVELLAPVGTFDAFKAAIAAGADAVYLGGSKYGARAYAGNFDNGEIIEAIKLAHVYNVKVYVTINILIYDNELADIISYVNFLYINDVDAVIIQDLGLMNAICQYFPDLEIHASTQMTIHNLEGINFLEDLGVKRVVLARENSINQVKAIIQKTKMDLEIFVHGALCVSYSGQCLMSSLIGGRSGNRGKCAQPCRKKYNLLDDTKKIIEENKYMISPRDLNTIENLEEIINSGVKSLKIEGRMKSAEYVFIVVSTYRKAIDSYYKTKNINISYKDLTNLKQVFNRQFTKGFLFNKKGNSFINLEYNKNIGIEVGKVISCVNKKAKIKLYNNLSLRDGIYFKDTNIGLTVSKIIKGNKELINAFKDDVVIIDVPQNIKDNTNIYKTTDIQLLEQASTYNLDNLIPIEGDLYLYEGKKPQLTIRDDLGNIIKKEIDYIVQTANNSILEDDKILKQLNKVGGTPYFFKNINIKRSENPFIFIGYLNRLRREAVDELNKKRSQKHFRSKKEMVYQYKDNLEKTCKDSLELSVYVRTIEQLKAALFSKITRIYVDECLIDNIDSNWDNIFLVKNKIDFTPCIDNNFKKLLIGNLGVLNLVKKDDLEIITDYNLNVTNSETIKYLVYNNSNIVTLPYEFNEYNYKNLLFKDRKRLEIIVYGYLESMITKHCFFASTCKKQCEGKYFYLEDNKKEKFSVYMDKQCHMHILNSKKLMLGEELKKLLKYGYSKLRLQFTIEDYSQTLDIINAYKESLFNNEFKNLSELIKENKENKLFTRAYFNKEIL